MVTDVRNPASVDLNTSTAHLTSLSPVDGYTNTDWTDDGEADSVMAVFDKRSARSFQMTEIGERDTRSTSPSPVHTAPQNPFGDTPSPLGAVVSAKGWRQLTPSDTESPVTPSSTGRIHIHEDGGRLTQAEAGRQEELPPLYDPGWREQQG